MLPIEAHHVTLRLLSPLDSLESLEYMKKHSLDSNMWEAWFKFSTLDHNDRLRECFNYLPKNLVVSCGIVFAESVLSIFEKDYPKDKRPRQAILAAKEWVKNPCQETADAARAARAANAAWAAEAAYAAARAAYAAEAAWAAWAAEAANAARAAAGAAAYAVRAAARAAGADSNQENKQIGMVLDVIRSYKNKCSVLEREQSENIF